MNNEWSAQLLGHLTIVVFLILLDRHHLAVPVLPATL